MQQHPEWIAYLVFILDLGIRIGLSLRILMRSNMVGVTFAWMTIVLAVPYLGALLYLLIGEPFNIYLGIKNCLLGYMFWN